MPYRDLSQTVESGMPVYPGDPPVTVDRRATLRDDGYRVSAVACGSHTGTHVDAPSHTETEGKTIDAVDVDRFALDAVRADCRGLDPRSPIGRDDLPETDAELLVVHTGWDEHWGERTYLDHPFLTPGAAAFCVERGYDVAIDAPNVDPTPTDTPAPDDSPLDEPDGVPAHHTLLGHDGLIYENLTNLSGLPLRFEFRGFPLKLSECDGAPVRAVARYD